MERERIISRKYIQLHYSIEANRSMDANNRNKNLQDIFLKWKKKQEKHAAHEILTSLCSLMYQEKASSPDNQNIKMPQKTFIGTHLQGFLAVGVELITE